MVSPESRDSIIGTRLEEVRSRISAACARSNRKPSEISLVAVTKVFPVDIIRKACALGIANIGENRVQELVEKFEDGAVQRDYPNMQLHLIGHLQSNKVHKAVQLAVSIDSVDSVRLAGLISSQATQLVKKIRVLVEFNTSGEPQKYGVASDKVLDTVEKMLRFNNLHVAGLMTVGPLVSDDEAIRRSFRALREAFQVVHTKLNPPDWSVLSMGMSGDYEMAIEEGATEIRLGTALFGPRRSL